MIEKHNFLFADFKPDSPKELTLLSIIAQSFYQPFSLEDNLLVILTALTSGSGVGFNRAMLFVRDGDRLKGEMWLGPRSPEEAGFIWEILATPGIGYIEIIEHNRSLVAKNEDTLSRQIKALSYSPDGEDCLLPAFAACHKEIILVRDARNEPLVDPKFMEIIQADEFLCVPLLSQDEVMGEIVLDNAFTQAPIEASDVKLAGLCGLIAGNYIYSTFLNRKLLDMEKMAAMGEMAMFVTHQLRNPLVTIGGFTDQILQSDLGEEKKRRNLLIIRNEVRRLEDIVYQMGHFLKVSTKDPVFFEFLPALETVLKSPEIQAKGEDYELIVDVEKDPPGIYCDPTSFGEIVRNLLDNAFDATAPGGLIHVRGHRKNSQWFVLSVRDTGQGISNPDKDQLFKPFFTTKENGMGLGLPFIKRVMDGCGGKIEVQSRLGKGAVFRLYFKSGDKGERP
jgi:signal transduction histidine kinase